MSHALRLHFINHALRAATAYHDRRNIRKWTEQKMEVMRQMRETHRRWQQAARDCPTSPKPEDMASDKIVIKMKPAQASVKAGGMGHGRR